jgi:hypothetical protein
MSNRTLLDISDKSFAYGHLYVVLSQITAYYNIMIFCKSSQLINDDDGVDVTVQNIVVYRDLFKLFPNSM